MNKEKILIIEDDLDTILIIRTTLEKEFEHVAVADNAAEGLARARDWLPALVLLDLALPDQDGFEVFRSLNGSAATKGIPVIMLTGKDSEKDIITGLELGAVDYITKPFNPRILLARIKAVLRRLGTATPAREDEIKICDLCLYPKQSEAFWNEKSLDLTQTEFKILHLLARKPGRVFTRYQIIKEIIGAASAATERSVDVQIVGLRKKLGKSVKLIETVRGIGYRFKENEEPEP